MQLNYCYCYQLKGKLGMGQSWKFWEFIEWDEHGRKWMNWNGDENGNENHRERGYHYVHKDDQNDGDYHHGFNLVHGIYFWKFIGREERQKKFSLIIHVPLKVSQFSIPNPR